MLSTLLKFIRFMRVDEVFFLPSRALSSCVVASALLIVSIISSTPVSGAFFAYPNQIGTDVNYVNISENSVTDPGPLFGAPSISGNQLNFNPSGFAATGSNGSADITDGQLNFEVWAHNNAAVSNLMLIESGDFTLFGTGTSATAVSVSTPTFITITEVDGVALVPTVQIATNMVFTPVGNAPSPFGNYNLATHAGTGVPWSGVLSEDISQKLIDENIDFVFGATKIEVVLDNVLTATSETGTVSLIAKKDFTGFTIVTNIPEPATCGLALIGLFAIASVRRRRK